MSLEIKGTVNKVHEAETKGTFTFRRLWVNTDPTTPYPQLIELQANKPELLDKLQVGQEVTCHINLRGRQWEEKVFNTLQVWKVEATTPAYQENIQQTGNTVAAVPNGQKDDLPF